MRVFNKTIYKLTYLALLLIIIFIIAMMIHSMRFLKFKPRSIDFSSNSIKSLELRKKALNEKLGVKIESPIEDVIFNVRKTKGMGSSFESTRVAIKVIPKYVNNWLGGWEEDCEFDYTHDLDPLVIPWKHSSKPEYFYEGSTNSRAVVFRKEGIIIIILYP